MALVEPIDIDSPWEDELEEELEEEVELDEASAQFVKQLVDRILVFLEELCDFEIFPYQKEFARRVIESVIINDGEEITALFSRQSGKTQTIAAVIATLMVLLPRLAKSFAILSKFKDGFMVGVFAPVEDQADTLWSRVVGFLTTDKATAILLDPEIGDTAAKGGTSRSRTVTLKKSKSFCRLQTCNPRAKIESKSYHLIVVDEAQDADEYTVRKSVHPMGAFYNASIVKTGTPSRVKGDFYKAIKHNQRRQVQRGRRQNHFQFDWRYCAKYNPNYMRFVKKEMRRLGQDSDEFQLAFEIRWLLERGMLVTDTRLTQLGDKSMQIVQGWWHSPVVVGIDPAKTQDSTVVTVVHVDWDNPDEFGFYPHRVLNWLELHGDRYEEQYFQIIEFLRYYSIFGIAVDAQGVGDAVAERLGILLPGVNVLPVGSNDKDQSPRWKHLMQLLDRWLLVYPAHSKARRLRVWRRFYQQMTDAEKEFKGPYVKIHGPDDDDDAHDDYVDSLCLACSLTMEEAIPEVQVYNNPFYQSSR